MNVRIITTDDKEEMEILLEDFIRRGWRFHGGLTILPQNGDFIYFQTVIQIPEIIN